MGGSSTARSRSRCRLDPHDAEAQTKQWLLTGAVKELDHAVAPVDDAVAIWSIDRARAAAWFRAEVVWAIREHPLLLDAYLAALAPETINRISGRVHDMIVDPEQTEV